MIGTQERNNLRTEERRYSAYKSDPRDYYEENQYNQNCTTIPRDDNYQNYLWDRLNSTSANPTYSDANSYYNPPIRGTARRTVDAATKPILELRPDYQTKQAEKKALNRQGKLILAVYLIVVVLIATLVIINAETLNTGSARTANPAVQTITASETASDGLYMLEMPNAAATVETNKFDQFVDKLFK